VFIFSGARRAQREQLVVNITFKYRDGRQHALEVEEGNTLMLAAYFEGLPGIEGICGGVAACGTCHVLVADEWLARCGSPDRAEEARLKTLSSRESGSRLACQISAHQELDGLVVTVAEE
jgi:ferredoxin, 2Fe-2S